MVDYWCHICDMNKSESYKNKTQFTNHFLKDHNYQDVIDYFWNMVQPLDE